MIKNWTLAQYKYEGDHKVFMEIFEGSQEECRAHAKTIMKGNLVLIDPLEREWEL
jgi:hypothetical protein